MKTDRGFFNVNNGVVYKNGKLMPYHYRPLTDKEQELLDDIMKQYFKLLKEQ